MPKCPKLSKTEIRSRLRQEYWNVGAIWNKIAPDGFKIPKDRDWLMVMAKMAACLGTDWGLEKGKSLNDAMQCGIDRALDDVIIWIKRHNRPYKIDVDSLRIYLKELCSHA